MNDEVIKLLKTNAERRLALNTSDFNPYDWSGGNFDDAWYSGADDGRCDLAREILDMLGIDYTIPKKELDSMEDDE
jgi:hypothetical protein